MGTAMTPEQRALRKQLLRKAVRNVYDIQKLRIAEGLRAGPQAAESEAVLDEAHKKFMAKQSSALLAVEKDGFKEVGRLLKGIPIYDEWLKEQKGVGPATAGILIAEINIENCHTVSHLWSWCGLKVVDGEAHRRKKGQKAGYNPWLKAKLLEVLGGAFLKSNSPWRKFYDDYKHRKQNTLVDTCPMCKGEGKYKMSGSDKKKKCHVCEGGTKPGPYMWGKSDAHRHRAAIRYMVKMFLAQYWEEWRRREGLPIRKPYAEEYLGRGHHAA